MPPNHHNHAEQARESFARDYRPKNHDFAIAIVGYGRHGKDEVALTLHKTGHFTFYGSTSWAALPEVAAKLRLPEQIAWEDRHNNREFWKSYCDYLHRDNPCLLIERLLAKGNIVSGIRGGPEIRAAIERNLFSDVLWIDRPGFPADPTVDFDCTVATRCIINDGTLLQLKEKVLKWAYERGYLTAEQARAAYRREYAETLTPENPSTTIARLKVEDDARH